MWESADTDQAHPVTGRSMFSRVPVRGRDERSWKRAALHSLLHHPAPAQGGQPGHLRRRTLPLPIQQKAVATFITGNSLVAPSAATILSFPKQVHTSP